MRVLSNQNGFTYILALTIVMIMGIMLGMVGQSWKTIKQRDQEKELLFRGSQIKEAIENWYNPKYTVPGVPPKARHPLMDLKDLLQDPYSLSKIKFLPQSYAAEMDKNNPKCAPDCAKLKIYQDPMTGKEWAVLRGNVDDKGNITPRPNAGIIGVASNSEETPFRTDFKGSALENMGTTYIPVTPKLTPGFQIVTSARRPALGGKMTKYSQWQFVYESPTKNDHARIYRAYHEGW
jgi:type II secretory pathway pseudopilin PulG